MTKTKSKPPDTARDRARAEIVSVVRDGLATYYEQHPGRLGDARSQDAVRTSTAGVAMVLAVLDRYEIGDAATPSDLERIRKQAYAGVLDAVGERFAVLVSQSAGETMSPEQVDWAVAQVALVGKEILAVLDNYEIGSRTKPRRDKRS